MSQIHGEICETVLLNYGAIMNTYLSFDVRLNEQGNCVDIFLNRINSNGKLAIGSVVTVAYKSVKIRWWDFTRDTQGKVRSSMRNMVKVYFKRRAKNALLSDVCKEYSKEEYNLKDQKTIDFFRKNGIKI